MESTDINFTNEANDKQVGLRSMAGRSENDDDSSISMHESPQQNANNLVSQTVTLDEHDGPETMEGDVEPSLGEVVVWTSTGEAVG